jgi:hypothetical protein
MRALSNKALKLTRAIGLSRMEALRATMRWLRRPSQLNAMFCGPQRAPAGRLDRRMPRVARLLSLMVGVVTMALPLSAECVAIKYPNPLARLHASSAVYAAEVLSVRNDQSETVSVKVLRSWKGNSGPYIWSGAHGLKVGEVYLVYADERGTNFDGECAYFPIPVARARADIAALDRYRGYRRFRVPAKKR